jgi:hypothetical protein
MMTERSDAPERREFTPEELEYLGQHREELRASLSEGRFERWILGLAAALGLVAYALGYVLKSLDLGEPIAFVADLLYGLGLALWTGVVVAAFVQVFPDVKRRQVKRYLDAYEARARVKSGTRSRPGRRVRA